jgi:hypothetical protein
MLENASANSVASPGNEVGALVDSAGLPVNKRRHLSVKNRRRSGVTTGRAVFVEGDGNSKWARRYRDLIAAHCSDLGGTDVLSEAQLSLIRRASAIELELEQMEGKLSLGEQIDLDVFTRSASHLRRLFETLGSKTGIERKCRDVTADGVEIEPPFSPMRARWQAEEAAKAPPEAPGGPA